MLRSILKQGKELDSLQHVLAGSHKEDGRGGLLIKVKGYGGTMTTVSCSQGQVLYKHGISRVHSVINAVQMLYIYGLTVHPKQPRRINP